MKQKITKEEPIISLSDFRQFLFNPIIPLEVVKDHRGEPVSKILPFWRKRELVPFIPAGKHHVQVSCSDILWLRILDTLRQFAYPIEKQLRVCDYFFRDAYKDKLPENNFRYNQELLNKKKLAGTISEGEQQTLEFIEESLKDEVFLYALRFDINYLTNLITDCLDSEEERAILIFWDGRVGEQYLTECKTHADYHVDPTEPHISISIRHLLKEFIHDEELSKLFLPQLLNEDEKAILRELKAKNLRELTIQLKDGNIQRIESTREGIISGAQAQKIREILGLKNYEKITLDTRDEKTLTFKKTKKNVK